MKSVIGLILLAAAVVGAYVLNDITRTEDGKSRLHVAEALAISVKVESPERRCIIRTVQAPGEVEAFSEIDISAEVVAKILELPIEEGDQVEAGDLLCRLDDAVYRSRIRSAKANIAKLEAIIVQTEADMNKAERDYRRQLRLAEENATSANELADYRTAHIRAGAAVEVRKQELIEAHAMLEQATEDIEKTVMTSPIDGVVSQLFAKEGEVVVMGTMNNAGTRLMVISDLSKMQVRCKVDESDAALVETGQLARIYLQSDSQTSIAAHVLRVGIKGTKPTGRDVVTFETLVLVDESDSRVKPGMTASVEIEVGRSDEAVVVPVQAVVHRKRRDVPAALLREVDASRIDKRSGKARGAEYLTIVFSIEDEVARPRLVTTGITDAVGVEILRGISIGDTVVIGPFRSLDQLTDGATVSIEGTQSDDTEAPDAVDASEARVSAEDR